MCVLEISRRCQSWVTEDNHGVASRWLTCLWLFFQVRQESVGPAFLVYYGPAFLQRTVSLIALRVFLLFEAISSSLYEPLHAPISQMESIALIYAQILMRKCCYLLLARQHPLWAGWARTALFVVWRFWPRSIAAPASCGLWLVPKKNSVLVCERLWECVFLCWPPFIAFKCPYTTQHMWTSLDIRMYLLTWLNSWYRHPIQ